MHGFQNRVEKQQKRINEAKKETAKNREL